MNRLAFLTSGVFFLGMTISHSGRAQGVFEGHLDVGTVLHAGTTSYDGSKRNYLVTGSGENMWFGKDDFQFAWKRMSGDVSISADITFIGRKGNNHRKAVLMIRQSLDSNSPAVDIARHGDGLTSLQFRNAPGADDHEVQFKASEPRRMRLEKRGSNFFAFFSGVDGKLEPAGAATKLAFTGPFYIGIGVCAHDKDTSESAVFSNVKIEQLDKSEQTPLLYSVLETVPVASGDRRVAYVAQGHFEAPNWSRDGSYFLFNEDGGIYRMGVDGGDPRRINTGSLVKCNNDHGISPDGTMLAISDSTETGDSLVYTVPVAGGTPKRITSKGPSYWHGWSPDGTTLAYAGRRDGDFDIYSASVNGGDEQRLTSAPGLDDGPEYSPDGQWIYFNSERSGHMQIWRMHADGTEQQQFLEDETNDWFPHISPDGKWLTFLAYSKDVTGHPPDRDVSLNLVDLSDKKVKVLATLFGGQGTNNVASWSPDSTKIAFVSYQYLLPGARE